MVFWDTNTMSYVHNCCPLPLWQHYNVDSTALSWIAPGVVNGRPCQNALPCPPPCSPSLFALLLESPQEWNQVLEYLFLSKLFNVTDCFQMHNFDKWKRDASQGSVCDVQLVRLTLINRKVFLQSKKVSVVYWIIIRTALPASGGCPRTCPWLQITCQANQNVEGPLIMASDWN